MTTGRSAADRNRGLAFDRALIEALRTRPTAVRRRIDGLAAAPQSSREHETSRMLRAIECLDLTTLAGDDTPARVRRLAAQARRPLPMPLARTLGVPGLHVAAVCVHHEMMAAAKDALSGSAIPVAVVSAGFPAGLSPLAARVCEIEHSVAAGADEVDVVIGRHHVLLGNWRRLYDEVRSFRAACGRVPMKVILATGELRTLLNVARASWVCMMAGADFIKTSTGKEAVNATLDASLVMLRAIRGYAAHTGQRVGFKAAGGISSSGQALQYLALVEGELGTQWLQPGLFRLGASSLLADLGRRLADRAASAQAQTTRGSPGTA